MVRARATASPAPAALHNSCKQGLHSQLSSLPAERSRPAPALPSILPSHSPARPPAAAQQGWTALPPETPAAAPAPLPSCRQQPPQARACRRWALSGLADAEWRPAPKKLQSWRGGRRAPHAAGPLAPPTLPRQRQRRWPAGEHTGVTRQPTRPNASCSMSRRNTQAHRQQTHLRCRGGGEQQERRRRCCKRNPVPHRALQINQSKRQDHGGRNASSQKGLPREFGVRAAGRRDDRGCASCNARFMQAALQGTARIAVCLLGAGPPTQQLKETPFSGSLAARSTCQSMCK